MTEIHYSNNSLTQLLLEYKHRPTLDGYNCIYDAILKYAYSFPSKISYKNQEHGGDFVLFIENKIPALIERFKFYGKPFESYLYRTFKGQFYTYINQFNKSEMRFLRMSKYPNYSTLGIASSVKEIPLVYSQCFDENSIYSKIDNLIDSFKNSPKQKSFAKRMWIYILKYSTYLDDQDIYNFGNKLGKSKLTMDTQLKEIKKERDFQIERKLYHNQLANQVFSQYINKEIIFSEQKDLLSQEEKEKKIEQIQKIKKHYDQLLLAFKNMSFCITNTALAKILDMPKGSIDTSIFHLKKMCQKLLKQNKH